MKKIILLAGVICLLFSSCEDFLDASPQDKVSDENFWKSTADVEKFIINIYSNTFPGRGGVGSTMFDEVMSDNSYLVWTWYHGDFQAVANGTANTYTNVSSGMWQKAYYNIRRCYQVLENIDKVESLTGSTKDQFLGEVHFFLAYNYDALVRYFGDVPLVEKVMTIPESKEVTRTPKAEVTRFVLEQIDRAASLLNGKEMEQGRVSWGAAQVLKARVLLANERWDEAATVTAGLMGKYTLHTAGETPYFDLFSGAAKQANEIILTIPRDKRSGSIQTGSIGNQAFCLKGMTGGDAYRSIMPTGSLVDAYPMGDGRLIHETGSTYKANDPYADRDPRFYQSIIYPTGTIEVYNALTGTLDEVLYDPEDASTIALQQYNANEPSATGYVWKKFIDWSIHGMTNVTDCTTDIVLMRYAEVLLMRAEALAEGQGAGAKDEICNLIDQLRNRVKGGLVHRENYNSKEDLVNLVRNERRVELAGEGQRYWDLLRWKVAGNENVQDGYGLKGDLYGAYMRLDGVGKNDPTVKVDGVARRFVETRYFTSPKNYILPVPQAQIDLNPNLTQNDGWK